MMTARHPLVEDYLRHLWTEAARLPVDQARELVADIEEHLHAALPAGASETQVRNVLERLGTPSDLVGEAGGDPPPPMPTAPPTRTFASPGGAVACLLVSELLFVTGYLALAVWVIGLVLMARVTVWSPRQKTIGFAVLASGLPVIYLSVFALVLGYPHCVLNVGGGTCTGLTSSYALIAGTFLVVQCVVAWRLLSAARQR